VSGVRSRVSGGTPDPRRLILFLAFCAVSACHGAPKSADAVTPSTAAGPRVVLPSGAVYAVELARTPEEQAQGLMFRESLPERTGMLFLFSDAAPHQFWMKNTMIPLDIVWLDGSGRVVFVSANTPPCRADPCPNYGPEVPAPTVLEIAGGMAAKEKVTVGSRITFEEIPK
jgi:uncharacterized membrane protein (UPF0127 family)